MYLSNYDITFYNKFKKKNKKATAGIKQNRRESAF